MSSFYIAAAHKSSGKTTLSIGLSAAIRQRGMSIQTFKKGPDYIDPIWLSQASGKSCYNLDFFTSSNEYILNRYNQLSKNQDSVLVEGNMGLFDGISLDGSDSNAAMAKLLNLPVILVVDSSGTSRGIAPLLMGYQQFDSKINYAGVILNKVAGERHEKKLREAIEAHTDFRILGSVPRSSKVKLTERHLGLIPSNEIADRSESIIKLLTDQVEQNIDIDHILSFNSVIPSDTNIDTNIDTPIKIKHEPCSSRIAIAMDEAFGFYYPEDLERFSQLGIDVIPFSTLTDTHLPDNIDGLFIGGGFPETQIDKLSTNASMLKSISNAIDSGLPCYAECGGLMYLCKELIQDNETFPLCNIIPATVNMNKKPQGRGYVELEPKNNHPWFKSDTNNRPIIKAHEFHYSSIHGLPASTQFVYNMTRGTGIDGLNDGIIIGNMLACYTHLRSTDLCSWVDGFVSFVNKHKDNSI